jgi:hypothetical protein
MDDATSLSIDDVIVRNSRDHVELDVRLRNAGGEVVNVTRAEIDVIERVPYAAAYKASAHYDMQIDGVHASKPISHVLRPGEVDSFVLRLGFTKFNTSCGFKATVSLVYNRDQRATSAPIAFESVFQDRMW